MSKTIRHDLLCQFWFLLNCDVDYAHDLCMMHRRDLMIQSKSCFTFYRIYINILLSKIFFFVCLLLDGFVPHILLTENLLLRGFEPYLLFLVNRLNHKFLTRKQTRGTVKVYRRNISHHSILGLWAKIHCYNFGTILSWNIYISLQSLTSRQTTLYPSPQNPILLI